MCTASRDAKPSRALPRGHPRMRTKRFDDLSPMTSRIKRELGVLQTPSRCARRGIPSLPRRAMQEIDAVNASRRAETRPSGAVRKRMARPCLRLRTTDRRRYRGARVPARTTRRARPRSCRRLGWETRHAIVDDQHQVPKLGCHGARRLPRTALRAAPQGGECPHCPMQAALRQSLFPRTALRASPQGRVPWGGLRHSFAAFGSSASRKPSPSRLNARLTTKIAARAPRRHTTIEDVETPVGDHRAPFGIGGCAPNRGSPIPPR